MSQFNGAQLGDLIVSQVREFVARSLGTFGERISALATRLEALEKREPVQGPPGLNGERGEKGDRGEKGETGERGADGAQGAQGEPGPAGRDGIDGKDGTPGLKGETGEKGDPGEKGEAGLNGKDGRDALQLEILSSVDPERKYPRNTYARHAGGLIRAFRDTDAINLAEIEKSGWEAVLEGIASEEEVESEDGRTITRTTIYTSGKKWSRERKSLDVRYRDVYRPETAYSRGDLVTYGGSVWHAQIDSPKASPGTPGSTDWKLVVKKGRDADRGTKG